jgi:dihydroorotate dehydrogenase
VRGVTTKPIIVKLSPDYAEENRRAIVPAIREVGIDAINFGNTSRVTEPRLSQGAGGVSGPSLFPNVLATISELRHALGSGPALIATGGIDTPAKAVAALEAGADAVSYFTAFITRGPMLPRRIGEAILATLDRRGLRRIRDLRPSA